MARNSFWRPPKEDMKYKVLEHERYVPEVKVTTTKVCCPRCGGYLSRAYAVKGYVCDSCADAREGRGFDPLA